MFNFFFYVTLIYLGRRWAWKFVIKLVSWYHNSCNIGLPDDELDCEEYDHEVVDHLNDEHNPRKLNIARRILFSWSFQWCVVDHWNLYVLLNEPRKRKVSIQRCDQPSGARQRWRRWRWRWRWAPSRGRRGRGTEPGCWKYKMLKWARLLIIQTISNSK